METAGPYKQPETVRNDGTCAARDAGDVHMSSVDDVKERKMKSRWIVKTTYRDGKKCYQPYRLKDIRKEDHPDNREVWRTYGEETDARDVAGSMNLKRDFVTNLSTTLAEEPMSEVECIGYDVEPETGAENVYIKFYDGYCAKIDVIGDDCGAIYRKVGAKVYGS